jgi:CRISPR-associated protein Csd2
MGSTKMLNYGLYKGVISVNPILAKNTGFSEKDLEVLLDSIKNMFAIDASSARPSGSMTIEKIVIFEHESEYGNAQTGHLLKLVSATPLKESPESSDDYKIEVSAPLPKGVSIKQQAS